MNLTSMHRIAIALLAVLLHVRSHAQPLGVYMLALHGASCDDQSGVLLAQGYGGGGNYTYLWDDGSVNDTLSGLGAGPRTVTVYSGGDSATATTVIPAWGMDTVTVHHVCGGSLGGPGWIDLDLNSAQYPVQYAWYDGGGNLLPETSSTLSSAVPDTFHYVFTDAEGCVDSGTVVLAYSNPVLEVTVTDSVLCYGQSALMWYTPGFTLYGSWGITYNSTTDTIYYVNQMGSVNSYPSTGVDAYGCEAEISNEPFVYQQPHPDAVTLYHHEDTISTTYVIDLAPSTTYTYIWYFNGDLIDTSAYSYLPIDTSGTYSVSIINQYGCSVSGTIEGSVSNTALYEQTDPALWAGPNPAAGGEPWCVMLPSTASPETFRVTDATGRLACHGSLHSGRNMIGAELPAGTYLLESAGTIVRLVRTR